MENTIVRLHPFFAHFPIVLLIAFSFIQFFKKDFTLKKSDYIWFIVIAISIGATLISGNLAEEFYEKFGDLGIIHEAIEMHEEAVNYLILNTILLLGIIFYFSKIKETKLFHKLVIRILALFNIGFVLAVGYYGAELVQVYGLGTQLFKL